MFFKWLSVSVSSHGKTSPSWDSWNAHQNQRPTFSKKTLSWLTVKQPTVKQPFWFIVFFLKSVPIASWWSRRLTRHFQRRCPTSSTLWRPPPRRPETAMRPHWWCRRRRWTRCGKFGEAFAILSSISVVIINHDSSIIIHDSSFIINHQSSIIIHQSSIIIHQSSIIIHQSSSILAKLKYFTNLDLPEIRRFPGEVVWGCYNLPRSIVSRRRNCGSSPWLPSCCRPLPRSNRNPSRGCLRCMGRKTRFRVPNEVQGTLLCASLLGNIFKPRFLVYFFKIQRTKYWYTENLAAIFSNGTLTIDLPLNRQSEGQK